jgi:hypothetical protein
VYSNTLPSASTTTLTATNTPTKTMKISTVMQYAAKERNLKSLALSVYFKHPDLGMNDYEILSRATAYLLSVDAKDAADKPLKGPYDHLEAAEERRSYREYKQDFGWSRVKGTRESYMDIGWLEYLAPYLWKDYYPQDWLSIVRQEHCKFSLGVYDTDDQSDALATFTVNSQPYHHPEGRDIALLHFRDENESLDTLRNLGVHTLFLRDPDKIYNKGEVMDFDGFVVGQQDAIDGAEYKHETKDSNEDSRVFFNYRETGILSFHTEDRFFATLSKPLPQGLCGAPVTDKDGDVCGTVEGSVPLEHKNEKLAGAAAFLPSFVMQVFIDFVERTMLEYMMPPDLFQMVVNAKKMNSPAGGIFKKDKDGKPIVTTWDVEYDRAIAKLKKNYSKEDFDRIMEVVQTQREDVLNTFGKEGGDLDHIIEKVRIKEKYLKALVQDQFRKSKQDSPPSTNTSH